MVRGIPNLDQLLKAHEIVFQLFDFGDQLLNLNVQVLVLHVQNLLLLLHIIHLLDQELRSLIFLLLCVFHQLM